MKTTFISKSFPKYSWHGQNNDYTIMGQLNVPMVCGEFVEHVFNGHKPKKLKIKLHTKKPETAENGKVFKVYTAINSNDDIAIVGVGTFDMFSGIRKDVIDFLQDNNNKCYATIEAL